jgi:hypothetical protein
MVSITTKKPRLIFENMFMSVNRLYDATKTSSPYPKKNMTT